MSRGKHQLTAIIYDKRKNIVSIGRNSYIKTHPLMAEASALVGRPSRIYLHAEIAALVKLKDWSKAHKMVVTRYLKDGTPANATPCASCQLMLKKAGIKLVEHT